MPTTKSSTKDKPNCDIQVMKATTCLTNSGKSTLGYQVGTDDAGETYLRVSSNDGGGFFSNEWLAFTAIQQSLKAWPDDQGITSMALRSLFCGKSANTPGFMIAVLCAEGILEPMAEKKRVHQACDPGPFLAQLNELRGGSPAKPKTKPRAKAKAKAAASAKRPSTRKKSPARSKKAP
jgi:hypothetical protein